jgi:hypothetical protein
MKNVACKTGKTRSHPQERKGSENEISAAGVELAVELRMDSAGSWVVHTEDRD